MGDAAVTESDCPGPDAAKTVPRRQQGEQSMVGVSDNVRGVLDKQCLCAKPWMDGRKAPIIFSAVFTTLCTDFLSEALQLPNVDGDFSDQHALYCSPSPVVHLPSSSHSLWKVVRLGGGRCMLLMWHKNADDLTRDDVCSYQVKVSVICTPRNLLLLTTSTAVLMVSCV